MTITGYTYDAAVHCVNCAHARFGTGSEGFLPYSARDGEGNEPHPVYSFSETDYPEVCDTCGEPVDTAVLNR